MKTGIVIFVVACMVALPLYAAERMPPDIRGTWVGVTNSAVYGTGQHHPDGKDTEVRFRRVEITFTFDKQEGRNFAGTLSSSAHSEPVVGAFASDLKSGVMVDPDGSYTFTMKGKDRIEICYMGTGGDKASAKVAACYGVRKKGVKK